MTSQSSRCIITARSFFSTSQPAYSGGLRRIGPTLLVAAALVCSRQSLAATKAAPKPTVNYAKLPLSFEPNQGQADPRVQFLSRGKGYSLFLTSKEAVLTLEQPDQQRPDTLRMQLTGANPHSQPTGQEKLAGIVNYFAGHDQTQWHTNIPTYGKVNYSQVYPGVDLVFYGNQRQLEYDFVVAPGADLNRIAWQIEGLSKGATPRLDKDGNLDLATEHGPAGFKRPIAYQLSGTDNPVRQPVDAEFTVSGNRVGFRIGSHDPSRPLIIDPVLSYSTYLGAAANAGGPNDGLSTIGSDFIYYPTGVSNPTQGIAIDSEGNAYVTGHTNATDFPVENPYQSGDAGLDSNDRAASAFVTKINPEGTALIYSTYLSGGQGQTTAGTAIAVDSEGSAYVTGYTNETTFPVTSGAFQTICGADPSSIAPPNRTTDCGGEGATNGFVTKLSPSGNSLEYSTFLGGASLDQIFAIAVDAKGQAYVAGNSLDNCGDQAEQPQFKYVCFPTTPGAVLSGIVANGYNGNAFLSVFDPKGANLLYSTFLGDDPATATQSEFRISNSSAVALDSAGNVYVSGVTAGTHLPTTAGAYQTKNLQGQCCASFIAKFTPVTASGSKLTYLTYLSGPDAGYGAFISGLAADADGEVYATGLNTDQNFPTTKGAFQTSCGLSNDLACHTAFLTKLNAAGSALEWSTMLGDKLNGQNVGVNAVGPVQLDSAGNVYVTGSSAPNFYDFPQVNPVQPASVSDGSPFITELNPTGSKVLFSTFFGDATGNSIQSAAGLAVDAEGNMYVAGNTDAGGIPATPGAFQKSFAGYNDGYVFKISQHGTAAVTLTASPNPVIAGQTVTLTAKVTPPPVSSAAAGTITFMNGATELGKVTLSSTGIASLAIKPAVAAVENLTAVYSGDSTYAEATSPAVKLTVTAAIATTTTLKITPNPAFTTRAITFTAQVKAASGTTIPAGSVTLLNGTATLATIALNSSGMVTYTTSSLAAGTYSINASYQGSTNFSKSSAAAQTLRVAPVVATTTTIAASPNPGTVGSPVTLIATVAPSTGTVTPTGTVTFRDGNTTLGTGTLNSKGVATFTTATLAVGYHAILASYSGSAGNTPSASATLGVHMDKIATSVKLTSSATSIAAGANLTLTATLKSSTGTTIPAGAVTFYNGNTSLGRGTVSATGVATLATTTLTAGTHSMTASYGGDATHATSVSTALTITVTAN